MLNIKVASSQWVKIGDIVGWLGWGSIGWWWCTHTKVFVVLDERMGDVECKR